MTHQAPECLVTKFVYSVVTMIYTNIDVTVKISKLLLFWTMKLVIYASSVTPYVHYIFDSAMFNWQNIFYNRRIVFYQKKLLLSNLLKLDSDWKFKDIISI